MAPRAKKTPSDFQHQPVDFLAGVTDAVWVVAPDYSVSYANDAAVAFHSKFYGTPATVGRCITDCYPNPFRHKWADRYKSAADGKQVFALESHQDESGESYFEVVLERSGAGKGGFSVVAIARPITDRRRTASATTLEARAIIDTDTYVLHASPHFRSLIGIAPDTPIRSLRLRDLLDPEDDSGFAGAVADATESPTMVDRLRIVDLAGSVHETVGTLARSPDSGNIALALLDITRQIETEVQLERNAEHLRALHAWAAELNVYMEQPDILYQRSLELLRNTVRFDSASVQLLVDDQLVVVACTGFEDTPKILGLTFPFDKKFPNWHVVTSRQIIAVTDVGDRYPHFREQADHFGSGEISSWLGVPLGVRDDVLGMVALDRSDPSAFTEDEQRLVSTMAGHIAVAVHNAQLYSALQASEERLVEANAQKEVLLRELHHRSKNNMQMISSLLSLGAAAVSVEEDGRVLDEVRMRIQSLAAVHEELYKSENLDRVDLSDYARRIGQMIVTSYGRPGVTVGVEASKLFASIDVSVPFGLILSELLLNSYKHAFSHRKGGVIRVELTDEDGMAKLVVRDDGIGLTREKWEGSQDSLGMQLVSSLVDQIGGDIELGDGPGATWIIRFPAEGRRE